MVNVFSGHEVTLWIAPSVEKEKSFLISDNETIEINNYGNKKVFPIMNFKATENFSLNNIQLDSIKISFDSIDLLENDELLLDFKNQIYELNGNSIIGEIEFESNKRISLKENDISSIYIDCLGASSLDITFDSYDIREELHYVEDFRIEKINNYNQVSSFSGSYPKKYEYESSEYSFSLGKHSTDWIEDDKEYRIMYKEKNKQNLDVNFKYLLGAVFTGYTRGFNDPDDIINDNLTGEAIKILNKKSKN